MDENVNDWASETDPAVIYVRGQLDERDRCRQLFLAWAANHFGWKIKDEMDERHIREMLEDIDSGAEPEWHLRLVDSDPAAQGLPTIR